MIIRNTEPRRSYRAFTARDLDRIPQLERFDPDHLLSMKAVARVLPFRVNAYVVDELIRWDDVPNDPLFQLTFPQPGMLSGDDLAEMRELISSGADEPRIKERAREIQEGLNPHPAGQMALNVPTVGGEPVNGIQHKYRETVLFFPSQGQTCHAYCTYCFRWPQFVGVDELKFASREASQLVGYLKEHPEVTDVLITGGDPLIMKTAVLRRYIEPLLGPDAPNVRSIRIGTKALAYWPYRVVSDKDADDLLRLFEEVVAAGKQLAFMAHWSHPHELETPIAKEAVRRVLDTGAVMRCQAPLIRHVNDDGDAWAAMWREQVQLGAIPYYMFVERNTGAKHYFEVPLARAHQIFGDAYRQVSGLARTVRGPSMSALPGKVCVNGVTELHGEKAFVLSFIQGRNPDWVGRPFFAAYDERVSWLNELQPAFGEERFFFEDELDAMWRGQIPVRGELDRPLGEDDDPIDAEAEALVD